MVYGERKTPVSSHKIFHLLLRTPKNKHTQREANHRKLCHQDTQINDFLREVMDEFLLGFGLSLFKKGRGKTKRKKDITDMTRLAFAKKSQGNANWNVHFLKTGKGTVSSIIRATCKVWQLVCTSHIVGIYLPYSKVVFTPASWEKHSLQKNKEAINIEKNIKVSFPGHQKSHHLTSVKTQGIDDRLGEST